MTQAENKPQIISSQAKAKPTPAARQAHMTAIQRQKEYFDAQPRETVIIRKSDGPQWVQVNGYAFSIRPNGEPVEVPRDVAVMLRNKGVA